ncbi:MAG: hypothetical protein ACXAC7_02380 [Candidatus Hodarchaeales archaeon]|jgi:hypothetical protein
MFDEIDTKQMEIFQKIATKLQLRSELKKIQEEIETLNIKGEIEGKDYSDEIQSLEVRNETLQEELEEESIVPDPIILNIRREVQEYEQRLQKLEEKKTGISEAVFSRLKTEYLDKKQKAKDTMILEEKKINKFNETARVYLREIDERKEELRVRASIGDITKEKLSEKLKLFKSDEIKAKIVLSATQLLINEEHL